ncbi:MAG: hypothetical protein HZB85_02240 [Deltaproteobacteria bacterium]|nr:hypothetical protein [Deltaproteobacteria bacterium]
MRKLRWVFCFAVFFLLPVIHAAEAGEFDLSETSPDEVVSIPGKNIKAGMFRYDFQETYEGRLEYALTSKAGIIVNDEVIYYVSVEGKEGSWVDPGGECNFGLYKSYFLMDCWNFGSQSLIRRMYLFRFKARSVELLDVISMASVRGEGGEFSYGLDFMSAFAGTRTQSPPTPIWTKVQDIDNDGNPEVKIWISAGFYFGPDFDLFLEIKDDRIHVDFTPALYKPLFAREKLKKRKKKSDAYYIYGFLSGELALDNIKRMPMSSNDEQRDRILSLLMTRDKWDAAFHNDYGEKPILMKRYIKKGR